MSTDKDILSSLPEELQLKIISHLRYHSILTLRQVSRHFHRLVSASDLPNHRSTEQSLLSLDEISHQRAPGHHSTEGPSQPCQCSPRCRALIPYTGTFPCYTCLTWLVSPFFSYNMTHGPHALGQPERHNRICMACGIRTNFYPPGSTINGHFICLQCSQPFRYYMIKVHPNRFMNARLCKACTPADHAEHAAIWEECCDAKALKKYLDGMRQGKEYRDQKGARLRLERGIVNAEPEETRYDITTDPSQAIEALIAYSSGLRNFYHPLQRSACKVQRPDREAHNAAIRCGCHNEPRSPSGSNQPAGENAQKNAQIDAHLRTRMRRSISRTYQSLVGIVRGL